MELSPGVGYPTRVGQLIERIARNDRSLTDQGVDLSSAQLGDQEIEIIGRALATNTTLRVLNLAHNSVGDNGAVTLGQALQTNSTLEELSLYGNSVGDNGAVALGQALQTNSTLTRLNLYENSVGDNGAVALGQALQTNSTLKQLILDHNSVEDNGAVALGQALQTNSTLEELNLYGNSVGEKGAVALGQALLTNNTFRIVNFYDWRRRPTEQSLEELLVEQSEVAVPPVVEEIRGGEKMELSSGVKNMQAVEEIIEKIAQNDTSLLDTDRLLWARNLGPQDCAIIGNALHTNETLQKLDLRANTVGDEGAEALAQALSKNKTLTVLGLEDNFVGVDGADALATALLKNTTLTSLGLQGNQLGPAGAKVRFKIETLAALNVRSDDRHVYYDDKGVLVESWHKFFSDQFLDEVDMGAVWRMEQESRETALLSLGVACVRHIETPEQLSCLLSTATKLRVLALNEPFVTADSQLNARSTELSGEIGCLTSLQHLRVVSWPCLVGVGQGIGSLICLQSLSFRDCRMLVDLPEEIKGLTSLQSLSLRNCTALEELPQGIGHLDGLLSLDLGGCIRLRSIPSCTHRLSRLQELDLDRVQSLSTPPLWIIDRGLHAIQQYLRDVEKGSYACLKKKVVLLGESGHGKTSLLDSLIAQAARKREESDRTVGVEVRAFTEKSISMVFYDFAGQEVYQATHGLFMSEGSLCILVVAHGLHTADGILRWLETIEDCLPGSVVLLVWTHLDHWVDVNKDSPWPEAEKQASDFVEKAMQEVGLRLEVRRGALLEEYRKLKGELRGISASTGTGSTGMKKAQEWGDKLAEEAEALEQTHERRLTSMQCIIPLRDRTERVDWHQCAEALMTEESRVRQIETDLEVLEDDLASAMDRPKAEKLRRIRRRITSTPKVLGNVSVSCVGNDPSFGSLRKILAGISDRLSLFIGPESKVPLDYLMLEELCRLHPQPTTLDSRIGAEESPENTPDSAEIGQEFPGLPWKEALGDHIQDKSFTKLKAVLSRDYVFFKDLERAVRLDGCGMSRDTLLGALRYLHTTGLALCYWLDEGDVSRSSSHVESPSGVVFLKPQWIIDAVKCVVREKEASGLNTEFQQIQKELKDDGELGVQLNEYLKTGRLSERLLRKGLWKGMKEMDQDVLIDLLTSEHFRILRKCVGPSWMMGGMMGGWFVVPSMIGAEPLPDEHRKMQGLSNQHRVVIARVSGSVPGRLFSEFQTFIKTKTRETEYSAHEVDLAKAAVLDRRDGSVLCWTYGKAGQQVKETLVVLSEPRREEREKQIQDIVLHARGELVNAESGECCWNLAREAIEVLRGVMSRFEGLTVLFLSVGNDGLDRGLNENEDLLPTKIVIDHHSRTESDGRTLGAFFAKGNPDTNDVHLEAQMLQRVWWLSSSLWIMSCNPQPLLSDLKTHLEETKFQPPLRAIHLAGHCTANQGWSQNSDSFMWNSDSGTALKPHTITSMVEMMKEHAAEIEIVFLNACYTLRLGQELQKVGFRYVVCWEGKVEDSLATELSVRFWGKVFKIPEIDNPCYPKAAFEEALQSMESDHPVQKAEGGMPRAEKLSGNEHQVPDEAESGQEARGGKGESPDPLVAAVRGPHESRPKEPLPSPSDGEPEGAWNKVILLSRDSKNIKKEFKNWAKRMPHTEVAAWMELGGSS